MHAIRVCGFGLAATLVWLLGSWQSGVASAAEATGTAGLPSAAAFGRDAAMDNVRMSPNGKLLAWSDGQADDPYVNVYDVATARIVNRVRVDGPLKLEALIWADDATLLLIVHFTRPPDRPNGQSYEFSRVLALDLSSSKTRMLLMGGGDRALVTGADLVCACGPRPGTILMSTLDHSPVRAGIPHDTRFTQNENDAWVSTLFEVDLRTGQGKIVAVGDPLTYQWLANDDLSVVARVDRNPQGQAVINLRQPAGDWRAIFVSEASVPSLHGLSADGHELIAIARAKGHVRSEALAIALDGSGYRVLAADPLLDITGMGVDRFTHQPQVVWLAGVHEDLRWLDPAMQARDAALRKSFGGRDVWIYDRSRDNTRVLASVSGPSQPAIFYLIDFAAHRADVVGESFPELANTTLAPVGVVHYKARDGYDLQALLTLPANNGKGPRPMVILPHGGPELQDSLSFDYWSQFIASRGYVVIQPQFRGSTGQGDAHRRAGYRQWGALMQDDLTDAVKAMIEQGIADPHRICIVGASYGGYAALAGAAFTPELYACAVSVGGISSLPRMLVYKRNQIDSRLSWDDPRLQYWVERVGVPTDEALEKRSPVNFPDRIRAPVLLSHGADDTVVPFKQSQTMYDSLRQFNKPATLVRLDGEDHWLSRATTRIRMLTELDAFLGRYLKGAGTP